MSYSHTYHWFYTQQLHHLYDINVETLFSIYRSHDPVMLTFVTSPGRFLMHDLLAGL